MLFSSRFPCRKKPKRKMYLLLHSPMGGPLTAHIDAPQIGLGMEKPFLTGAQSDYQMTHSNTKYRGDRFRSKVWNQLVPTHTPSIQSIPEFQLQQQAFSTSYSTPCTFANGVMFPSPDPTVEPQCSTCLRLLTRHGCITENNQYPNGTISNVAVNTSSECADVARLALNECGVQCGQPQNYERVSGSVGSPPSSSSVSCWPPRLVAALSM